jgi:hypothetical protein
VFLGDVSRRDPFNAKGNHERAGVMMQNEAVLKAAGGAWDRLPEEIPVSAEHRAAIGRIADGLLVHAPCGLKDPRVLPLLPTWRAAARRPTFVGTFRHPAAVARSLARRNEWPPERSYALWIAYNEPLVALHRAEPFPLLAFDLTDAGDYVARVAGVALGLGLSPDLAALHAFVSRELDHAPGETEAVPKECAGIWDYLTAHAAGRPEPGSLEAGLLAFLEDRRRFADEWGSGPADPGLVARVAGRLRRMLGRS